jgi:hypothetical protein
MDNLTYYNQCKDVPDFAKKEITSGRLRGFTDISPMWRIQKLTEMFGPCGLGWWYVIKDKRIEAGAGDERKCFVDIDLYYKVGDVVSQPIPGTGGSQFVTKERNGLYTDDECYKKALTDALSVAAKALGVGGSVYLGSEQDKYTQAPQQQSNAPSNGLPPVPAQQTPRQQTYGQAPRPQQSYNQAPQRQDNRYAQAPQQPQACGEAPQKPLDGAPQRPDEPIMAPDGYYHCDDCGEIITRTKAADGGWFSPKQVAIIGKQNFGRYLCSNCYNRLCAQVSE